MSESYCRISEILVDKMAENTFVLLYQNYKFVFCFKMRDEKYGSSKFSSGVIS